VISSTQLRDGSLKTPVFAFGRYNPPTIGHEILVNKVATVAKRNRGDAYIFPSSTQDSKKNPLEYKEKIKWMKKMFKPKGEDIFKYSGDQPKDALKSLSLLHDEGYEEVIMVVGSDRVNQFKKLLPQYNGVDGKAHGFYDFKKIEIESAGERDPDADDATGMSASKLRSLAVDGDFDNFKEGLPDILSDKDKRSLYQSLRKGMRLSVIESQIKEKLGPGTPIGKMKNSVKDPKKAMGKFVSKTAPPRANDDAGIDDIMQKADSGVKPELPATKIKNKQKPLKPPPSSSSVDKESLCMDKLYYEDNVYHLDTETKELFKYLEQFATTKPKQEYYKRALKETEEFWDKYEMAFGGSVKVALWEISRLREYTKKAADFITLLGEDVDYNVANLSYMNERIDKLPTNNIDINKPVSSKLQEILGLKEWHKDRAKEGQQLEIGTDKYRQYTVDLTPEEDYQLEQNKKRVQQTERVSKMISKIIANRSK